MGTLARLVILLIVLTVGLPFIALSRPAGGRAASSRCPVTPPRPDKQGASPFDYGNARIRAQIWPNGHLIAGRLPGGGSLATINRDGSITAKLGWWRGVPGRLVIRGRRIDRHAPRLRADVPPVRSYGATGFIPSLLTFPTVGCWRVVGAQGGARLSFVVEVTKAKHKN